MDKAVQCVANGCRGTAVLMAVDNRDPVLQRNGMPACSNHIRLWYGQYGYSFWWFPLGDDEATSLTQEQVEQALHEMATEVTPKLISVDQFSLEVEWCESCVEGDRFSIGMTIAEATTQSVNPDFSGMELCAECAAEYDSRITQ